jgi:hypothetical protein
MATISNVSKAAIAGFAVGAIVSTFAGFTFGGWLTSSKADSIAQSKVSKAVVAELAPVCADRFNRSGDKLAKLSELKGKNEWDRAVFIQEGGWAKSSGSNEASRGVARACAELIVAEK